MRALLFAFLIAVSCCEAAWAQSEPAGYVQGLAGVANVAESDVLYGAGAAVRARSRFDVFGEIGRLENGIWDALRDELGQAGENIQRQIQTQFGTAAEVSFRARVPIWYGLGGVRFRGPRAGPLGLYLEAAAGMARLRPRVELEVAGERLDAEARSLLELEDARAELLTAVGAGISLDILRRIRIEGGYRYSRVHGDLPFDINRVHAGVGFVF